MSKNPLEEGFKVDSILKFIQLSQIAPGKTTMRRGMNSAFRYHEGFHVDKMSSAHVYLRLHKGQTIDDISKGVLEDCAQLVKANSIQGNKVNNVTLAQMRSVMKFLMEATWSIKLCRELDVTDPAEIEKMVDQVLAENPKQLEQYRGGKTKLQGKANPRLLNKILLEKLKSTS
ncbi:hypothetical protein K1719_039222 [Acacia pycnantha]|nr:hypothetical protein K1719_039222 [Acacia pycnantha]